MGDRDEIGRIYRERYSSFLRVAVAVVRDERLGEEAVHEALCTRTGFTPPSMPAGRR